MSTCVSRQLEQAENTRMGLKAARHGANATSKNPMQQNNGDLWSQDRCITLPMI
jgi:hypothetical protein